jgi:putative endonuclease
MMRPRVASASNAARGLRAEDAACAALIGDGFTILRRRARTKGGEIDVVAERAGLVVFAEVKCRPDLATAAYALGARQQMRLLAAAEILLGENPGWGSAGARFDVLLVDRAGRVRRISDAFRVG